MTALGEFLDHLGVEGGDVVGIAAGDQAVVDDHFLLVFNGAPEDKVFTVPTVVAEAEWTVVLDTAAQTDAKVDEQHREVSGGYELAMPAR